MYTAVEGGGGGGEQYYKGHYSSKDQQKRGVTRDGRAKGLSLTGITALCLLARPIYHSLVLVQPRKTHPYISERLLNNQIKQNNICFG